MRFRPTAPAGWIWCNRATSSSAGTGTHLAAELFKNAAGIDLLSVPYKNITATMIAVMSGEVPVSFTSIYSALPQVRAGKARALAVTGSKRSAAAPELPTVSEAGLPGYESRNWYGFLATAGTPRAIVEQINAGVLKALQDKEVVTRLSRQGGSVQRPDYAESAVRQALYRARREGRPLVLSVPIDVATQECAGSGHAYVSSSQMFPGQQRIRPDVAQLQAATNITQAQGEEDER